MNSQSWFSTLKYIYSEGHIVNLCQVESELWKFLIFCVPYLNNDLGEDMHPHLFASNIVIFY